MKGFLKENLGTESIDEVALEDLKKEIGGTGMLSRLKYRRDVQNAFSGKRPAIAKGEIFRTENAHAKHLEEKDKH